MGLNGLGSLASIQRRRGLPGLVGVLQQSLMLPRPPHLSSPPRCPAGRSGCPAEWTCRSLFARALEARVQHACQLYNDRQDQLYFFRGGAANRHPGSRRTRGTHDCQHVPAPRARTSALTRAEGRATAPLVQAAYRCGPARSPPRGPLPGSPGLCDPTLHLQPSPTTYLGST